MQDRRFPDSQPQGITQTQTGTTLDTSAASVLKNTYMLLGLTIAFSAVVAFFSMMTFLLSCNVAINPR